MKRLLLAMSLMFVLAGVGFALPAEGHGGGLDSNGGHHCREAGYNSGKCSPLNSYHCHQEPCFSMQNAGTQTPTTPATSPATTPTTRAAVVAGTTDTTSPGPTAMGDTGFEPQMVMVALAMILLGLSFVQWRPWYDGIDISKR